MKAILFKFAFLTLMANYSCSDTIEIKKHKNLDLISLPKVAALGATLGASLSSAYPMEVRGLDVSIGLSPRKEADADPLKKGSLIPILDKREPAPPLADISVLGEINVSAEAELK